MPPKQHTEIKGSYASASPPERPSSQPFCNVSVIGMPSLNAHTPVTRVLVLLHMCRYHRGRNNHSINDCKDWVGFPCLWPLQWSIKNLIFHFTCVQRAENFIRAGCETIQWESSSRKRYQGGNGVRATPQHCQLEASGSLTESPINIHKLNAAAGKSL